ncbi:MAG: AMP-binding protein [Chloroflexi bacterium]|nr:AMP-binding protein [Chloroflexota bacterium]MCC6894117.1 AMP-binding protein [Anaerolineae bacterium]
MLTLSTRDKYLTLLDAVTLAQPESDRPAIIFVATDADPVHISRQQFSNAATEYAAALTKLNIAEGDLVIIAHTQNLESIYAFWGAMLIGAIPSMFPTLTEKLDPEIYMRDIGELVTKSAVKAILTTDSFAPTLAEWVSCPVYGSQTIKASNNTCEVLEYAQPMPSATAFLQHSSGTTGLQKGVALSHEAVLNQLAAYSDALKLNENDVIVSWLPLYHDMGLIAGFVQPLVQGVPLVLMSPFDWVRHPAMLLKAIRDYKTTLCWLPNFAYNHLARTVRQRDSEGIDLSSIRAFINCSEPVRDDSHRLFAERFAINGITLKQLTVSYAMAENTFAVTQSAIDSETKVDLVDRQGLQNNLTASVATDVEKGEKVVSCGKPIHGTMVRVVNDNGQALGERQVGEIMVKSNCMLTNYYHRDDLQPFDEDGWYKTGDKGYLADGEVYIVGRSKDLIINAGKNVYPQDIEAIVNSVAGVHPGRAVAFGVPDEREGTELIAVVAEADVSDAAARKQLTQAIRQQVGRQSDITLSFVTLVNKGWLIKTSSGKIARGKNREKWLAERQAQ